MIRFKKLADKKKPMLDQTLNATYGGSMFNCVTPGGLPSIKNVTEESEHNFDKFNSPHDSLRKEKDLSNTLPQYTGSSLGHSINRGSIKITDNA